MSNEETPIGAIRSAPLLMLLALVAGCGGARDGGHAEAVPAAKADPAIAQSALLQPVERPVAKRMDRGADHAASLQPIERPVAKPVERPPAGGAESDRS